MYANWLESPGLHVFDLIGADGQDPDLATEDSDIVGNVIIQNGSYTIARIGGDGTGASAGRYRFAYNTIVISPSQGTVFRIMDEIESLALHDNVFLLPDGGSPNFFDDEQAVWTAGSAKRSAQNNFVQSGLDVPSFFTGTITGSSAGFEDFAVGDLVPAANSPLVDAGAPGSGPAGFEIDDPLTVPIHVPAVRMVEPRLQPIVRGVDASPDIGAYERGGAPPGGTSSSSSGAGGGGSSSTSTSGSGSGPASSSSSSGSGTGSTGASGSDADSSGADEGAGGAAAGGSNEGATCAYTPSSAAPSPVAILAALALFASRRRRSPRAA